MPLERGEHTVVRHNTGTRSPLIRRAPGMAALSNGIVTLSLAFTLVACGGGATVQVGSALATPIPTATVTSAAPTATATIAPTPTRAASPVSGPLATTAPFIPTIAPSPTPGSPSGPTATRPAAVTPTRPASSPTAQPAAGGNVVRDDAKSCQLTLPAGYTVDSEGDGFDANDDNGFGVLTSATGQSASPEALAQSLFESFTSVMSDVQQGKVTTTGDTSRIDFTATFVSSPSDGSVYVKKFGSTVCAISVVTYNEAQIAHATAMTALIATLRENK